MGLWITASLGACAAVLAAWWLHGYRPAADPRIVRVALSPSGRWLAAASASGSVSVMAAASGTLLARVTISGGVCNDLQFSPSGDALAVAGRSLWVWPFLGPSLPRRVRADSVNYGAAEYDPDGVSLLSVTGEGRIERIDIRSGKSRWSACCTSIYGDVRYAPGGRTLVHAGHVPSRRNAESGALLERLVHARSEPAYGPVAFDRARGHVCLGSQDGSVLCRDAVSLAATGGPPRQPRWIEGLAISPDGDRATLAVRGVGLRLWDRRTGAVLSTGGLPSSNVVLSADGSSVLFGTHFGRIELLSARTGELVRTFDCR